MSAPADSHPEFKPRMQPIVAWRAMRKLLADKEDTAQVFRIIRALNGREEVRNFNRFKNMETGAKILSEKRDIIQTLNDRDALRQMPEGSLGRAYLEFVEREYLTADGLVEAQREGQGGEPMYELGTPEYIFGTRLRDTHDLWHVLTDYGRDGLGELCLLAFSYAQTRTRGIGFIVLIGALDARKSAPYAKILKAVREGYRAGKRAAWMPATDWESLLHQPIDDVRQQLNISTASPAYRFSFLAMAKHGVEEYARKLGMPVADRVPALAAE